MTTENESNHKTDNESTSRMSVPIRGAIGAVIGLVIGGGAGYFIDTMFTSDPYIGVRLGSFLGAMIGGQIGGGGGLLGIGVLMVMCVCSLIGGVVPLLIWRPDPASFLMFLPVYIGGIFGAFIGLRIGVRLLITIRKLRSQ